MTATDQHIFSFACGPFQATLYPAVENTEGQPAFFVDIYHAGTNYTYPRFVCTAEEVDFLSKLTSAADSLVRDFLGKGLTFTDWCAANKVNPFDPELVV